MFKTILPYYQPQELKNTDGYESIRLRLNYHMSVMTRDHEDRCRFCDQERDTFFHFVTQCPRLLTYRADLVQHCEGIHCLEWEPEKVLSRVF